MKSDSNYPGVLMRVKAVIADSVILLVLMIGVTFLFNRFDTVNDSFRIAAFLFIFVFYDPLFTSLFGGTIGHKMNGLCVKRGSDHQRNVMFPLTVVRFLAKAFLGWISLLTISGNEERKAIHDFLVGSVVLYEKKG
ncbi:MAG: RDD family protein [Bacteroidota bacterium]